MRLSSVRSIEPGSVLAQSIYNDYGSVLLAKGIQLNKRMIDRLINQGITYIYIEDEFTKDLHIEPVIPDKLRTHASNTIKETFIEIGSKGLSGSKSFLLDDKKGELRNIAGGLLDSIVSQGKSISLLADIYISDNYIFQHSLNVAMYAASIGIKLNMTPQKLEELVIGAMLHDIGKIFISPKILNKIGPLSDEEFAIIKTHAELGYIFLREQREYSSIIAHCAYQHHERLDGTGYPRGLKGHEIITPAKIIAIADVFDAVTSNRIYRQAMLPHEGLELVYAGATGMFDKDFVEIFRNSIAVYPKGLTVILNDQRTGVVIEQNKYLADRPIIRVIEEYGKRLTTPYEVDLAKELNVTITKVIKG